MKQHISQTHLLLSLILFSSCSTSATLPPSQNSTLNSVSTSNVEKEQSYWMQEQLDSFLKDEWNTTIEEEKKGFTLQKFADKQSAYRKAHPVNHSKSNVTKLNSMPVIGEGSTRR